MHQNIVYFQTDTAYYNLHASYPEFGITRKHFIMKEIEVKVSRKKSIMKKKMILVSPTENNKPLQACLRDSGQLNIWYIRKHCTKSKNPATRLYHQYVELSVI